MDDPEYKSDFLWWTSIVVMFGTTFACTVAKLYNTGFSQEYGQLFTCIGLAGFLLSSMAIKS